MEKPDTVDGVDIEVPEFYVSYKPQKIALTYPGTVRQFLHEKYGIHTLTLSLCPMS